jgi:hypothetical protein
MKNKIFENIFKCLIVEGQKALQYSGSLPRPFVFTALTGIKQCRLQPAGSVTRLENIWKKTIPELLK